LAWNDLGMHCYNADFAYLAVLPPYNTLWAQVIQIGDPPRIVTDTSQIRVTYYFADNTYSAGKSNFWQYEQQLFGVDLPPNVGLTGKGLSGSMDVHPGGSYFVAEGIPLTEFRDSAPSTRYPYQLATVILRDANTDQKLAEATVVAPVSTEMHCDHCHSDGQQEGIATGSVEKNILALHDHEGIDEYPAGHQGSLVGRAPILCAECHSSNALNAPGVAGVPSLSNAIHREHAEHVPSTLVGCYQCHPGPQTQCLRDVMSQRGMECQNCHGTLTQIAANPSPWFNEPRCDNSGCHGSGPYDQDQALYRMSRGHGGVYCAACHDSPHAIAPSREGNDHIKFQALQGDNGPLERCTVCHLHTPEPSEAGPHGITAPSVRDFSLRPDYQRMAQPGAQVVYMHDLSNTGNLTDTYQVTWTSSQGWAEVTMWVGGVTATLPVGLPPGESAQIEVKVSIPTAEDVRGMRETTLVTATSQMEAALIRSVRDITAVPDTYVYMPLLLRHQ
jgi:hypothetical protein